MNTKNYLTHTKKYKILMSAIHSVYRLISSTFELNELITRLTRLVYQILDVQYCLIILLDSTKKYSLFKCSVKGRKKTIVNKKCFITNSIERKIIKNISFIKTTEMMALPLVSDDIIGLILVKRDKNKPSFEDFNRELLNTISEQAIIGIKNLELYEEQQKIVLGSIKSLVSLLDTRVPQEYAHSPYFSRLVIAIAHQMRLDEKQIESLKYASLLHDAGKIDIPAEILTKTTKLTTKEYNIIKKHPLKGAQILRPLQILKPAIPIIMHHHEKYDGTGYPSRLKKGQIPLGARIMAVADAFEAMVYGRPYRERMDIHSALKEIKKKSGKQFDPKVVEAFLKISKNFKLKIYLHKH
ncbi:MAG: HD domain-containing phosphohydrolase [Candidatus Omnitrophota bacterium]